MAPFTRYLSATLLATAGKLLRAPKSLLISQLLTF